MKFTATFENGELTIHADTMVEALHKLRDATKADTTGEREGKPVVYGICGELLSLTDERGGGIQRK